MQEKSDSEFEVCKAPECDDQAVKDGYCATHYQEYIAEQEADFGEGGGY